MVKNLTGLAILLFPAILILVVTIAIAISFGPDITWNMFLTHAKERLPIRFVFITLILLAPISSLSRLLGLIGRSASSEMFFGELVKAEAVYKKNISKSIIWLLRPLQGIGLSMIFAQRLLDLFQFSAGSSPAIILLRPTLFILSSLLVSLLLSLVWALDDLGIRIYNRRGGEVHTAGASIGTILPIVFGALGIYNLFHAMPAVNALMTVVGIAMVLYPPYVIFAIVHHHYVKKRFASLSGRLRFRSIGIQIR